MPERFLILDRDGTLIHEKNYLHDADGVELIESAGRSLRDLQDRGWRTIVITNQSGIGRGLFTVGEMDSVHQRIRDLLAVDSVKIDAFYHCPHAPTQSCDCRKPGTGLAKQAIRDFGFDPALSVVVGDKSSDIELGKAIGALTILVKTGYGLKAIEENRSVPDFIVESIGNLPSVLK